MKLTRFFPLLMLGLPMVATVGTTGCKDKDGTDTTTPPAESTVLSGDISSNKQLDASKTWTLQGYVYVKSGATLTIPAGTIIKSDVTNKGALIVEPGGKIMAEGTAAKPIVFTSGLPKGQRRAGDWGGIIILGNATTNRGTSPAPTIEGGVGRTYGGTNDADNSGVLRYVRIEFAGIAAAPGSEINGLTLGGVGSGTTIENVMVSYANDDAFEFFGGTVNCKNLIAWAAADDDYDYDFGYRGNIQYAISAKHPQYADIGDASNGVECDNDGTGTSATPRTRPVMSNFTFVGPGGRANTAANHNFALRFRRASQFVLRNSVHVGHLKGGFSLESAETSGDYNSGTSQYTNNVAQAITAVFNGGSGSTLNSAAIETKALSEGTVKVDSVGAVGFTDWRSLTAPNFTPTSGSILLSGANFNGMPSFFETVGFRGAIGTTNWTSGWANWDPNNTDY